MSPAAPALPRRKLPIGIQTLAKLREEGCYYVDKSGLAVDLIESGKYYFMSRPRRFGKSQLVDTFKELFEDNRALFEGLAAETRWDWSRRHPVIRISFADGVLQSRAELERRIQSNLRRNRSALGLPRPADIDPSDTADDLSDLIEQAHLQADESLLMSFELEHIEPAALLFQSGYLTLQETRQLQNQDVLYTLGYPNREVEVSLNRVLLPGYGVPERVGLQSRLSLLDALIQVDALAIETSLRALFAGIPSDWYRRNPLAGFEGHYASVFYSHLAGLALDLRVEDATKHGRIDLTVTLPGQVFLFEFKVVADAAEGHALRQIREKGYAEKYLGQGASVHLIGVEFSKTACNVIGFEVETVAR